MSNSPHLTEVLKLVDVVVLGFQMPLKMSFLLENLRAERTAKGFQLAQSVHACQVQLQFVHFCVLPSANVTLVRSLAGLSSRRGGVAVRSVVVSADC